MRVYREVAHIYGNVDPNDTVAVEKFYEDVLPTKPLRLRQEVFDTIFSHDGEDESPINHPLGAPNNGIKQKVGKRTPLAKKNTLPIGRRRVLA
jgi:hypothetical protein